MKDPSALAALVRNFDRDHTDATAKLRDWLAADPRGFYRSAIEVLRTEEDSRARRSVVGLLVGGEMLEDALGDPQLGLNEAVEVARLAIETDPRLEISLARRLAESVAGGDDPAVMPNAVRLMSVLAGVSDGKRILPSLARLLHSSNPYLRSKAVLMIARGNRSTNWVQNRLLDSDPRNRANAVEALWGVDSYAAREVLLSAVRDSNNRVAGNALLGLYQLGECSVLTEAAKMASHQSSAFRVTAAWLMGEMADERLRPALAQLMQDPASAVRLRAFKALGRMKAALAGKSAPSAGLPNPCRIAGRFIEAAPEPAKGVRKLHVSVTPPDGRGHIQVLPVQFFLWEDGSPVLDYRVTLRPGPKAMSVVFVLPRLRTADAAWVAAVRNCLNWKRTSDLWAYLTWTAQDFVADGGDLEDLEDSLAFSARPQALEAALLAPSGRDSCSDLWHAFYRALRRESKAARGQCHVLVFCPETVPGAGGEALANALSSPRASVQVISSAPNTNLEKLCRRTKTSLVLAETPEAGAAAIEQAYLGLLGRYEIAYHTNSPAMRQLEIQVRAPAATGAATLPVPPMESAAR